MQISTPEELNINMKDDKYIKEFCNYVVFEGMDKTQAFVATFDVAKPLSDVMKTKMYRWIKKDAVQKWLKKSNKSLEVDWIDKRINALQHLYDIGTDKENSEKAQIDGLNVFLTHLNKEENKIRLDIGGSTQINIVQVVQDKLSMITNGSTVMPNGAISYDKKANDINALDAIMSKTKVK